MTPAELQSLRDVVASREMVRTHHDGCWLSADHRDCAILRLLSEVERLRAQRDALAAAGDCVVLACFDTAQRKLISTRLLQQVRDLQDTIRTIRAARDEKENTDG